LGSLGLSLVPNKRPELPIRPVVDPNKLIAGPRDFWFEPDQVAPNRYKEFSINFSEKKYDSFLAEGMLPLKGTFYVKGSVSVRKRNNLFTVSSSAFAQVVAGRLTRNHYAGQRTLN